MPSDVKKFWLIAAILDPRFKKLIFDTDTMVTANLRRDAVKYVTEEYENNYKHKVHNPSEPVAPNPNDTTSGSQDAAGGSQDAAANAGAGDVNGTPNPKRRKVSSASLFRPRVPGEACAQSSSPPGTPTVKDNAHKHELKEYLKLPQVENEHEWVPLEWWQLRVGLFPNLEVMARQYLGCPATSATVERLFSAVGISFSKKRQSSSAETLADLAFTKMNVDGA